MRCHLTFQGIAVVKLCSCRALGSSETRSNTHGRGPQHHVGWNTVVDRGLNHVGGASVCFIVSTPPSNESQQLSALPLLVPVEEYGGQGMVAVNPEKQ